MGSYVALNEDPTAKNMKLCDIVFEGNISLTIFCLLVTLLVCLVILHSKFLIIFCYYIELQKEVS